MGISSATLSANGNGVSCSYLFTYLAGNSAKYLKYSLYVLVQRSPNGALSCNFLCLSSLLMVSMTSFLGKLSWDYCWLEKEGTLDWWKFETKVGYRPCLSRNTYTILYTPTTVACRVSHVISVSLSGQMFTHTSLREQTIELVIKTISLPIFLTVSLAMSHHQFLSSSSFSIKTNVYSQLCRTLTSCWMLSNQLASLTSASTFTTETTITACQVIYLPV